MLLYKTRRYCVCTRETGARDSHQRPYKSCVPLRTWAQISWYTRDSAGLVTGVSAVVIYPGGWGYPEMWMVWWVTLAAALSPSCYQTSASSTNNNFDWIWKPTYWFITVMVFNVSFICSAILYPSVYILRIQAIQRLTDITEKSTWLCWHFNFIELFIYRKTMRENIKVST